MTSKHMSGNTILMIIAGAMNTLVNESTRRFSRSSLENGNMDGSFIVLALKNPVVAMRFKKKISMNVRPRKSEMDKDIRICRGPISVSKYPAAIEMMPNMVTKNAVSPPLNLFALLICLMIFSGSSLIRDRFIGFASRYP